MTILTRMLAGAAAGTLATVTMTGSMAGAERAHLLGEPPPRKITRAAMQKVTPRLARDAGAVDAASVLAHVGFGAAMGALYALVTTGRRPSVGSGLLFGSAVWAASYAGWVPAMRIMAPPSEDRPGRPSSMLFAHWVYGATLARTLRRFV